jgi:hypothetical protein
MAARFRRSNLADDLMHASVFPASVQQPSMAPQVPDPSSTPGGGVGLSAEVVDNVQSVARFGGTVIPANQGDRDEFLDRLTSRLRSFLTEASITASRPAHVDPNYWSQPVDLSGSISVAAGAFGPGIWSTIVTYTVPSGNWARISGYGVNVQDPTYTYDGSLVWRIVVNGQPVQSIESFSQQRGSLAQPRQSYIIVKQDQFVALQVRRAVAAAGSQTVEGCLVGWRWQPRNAFDNAQNTRTL